MVNEQINVPDKGFVRLVDYMGDDQRIVDAARVSYADGTKHTRSNAGLIDYLMRHHHTSPFEMVTLVFHIKMPIFIARQWVRHRTASLNEISGRYSVLTDDYYIPEPERLLAQDTVNKQGSSGELSDVARQNILHAMNETSQQNYAVYEDFLADGLARETARITLPLNMYTEMYWQMNLHNLFHFLRLRIDSHAQWEIQQYANALTECVKFVAPLAYQSWENHVLNAVTFSQDEMALLIESCDITTLRSMVNDSDLSNSRKRELLGKLS